MIGLGRRGVPEGWWARKCSKKEVRPVFFNRKWTDARCDELQREVEATKRAFQQLVQEWDATSARVTKVLRRIRTAEVAQEREETGDIAERLDASTPSTIPTPPGRLDRIRQQLAARGGKDGG